MYICACIHIYTCTYTHTPGGRWVLMHPGVNCLNLTALPNLHLISPKAKFICFDEAAVRWCLDNMRMVQGPEMLLTMGDIF